MLAQEPRDPRIMRWLPWAGAASAVFVVVGLLATAVARFVSDLFYSRLGLRPEEVGINIQDLVVQSLPGLLYWLTLPLFVLLPLTTAGLWVLNSVLYDRRPRLRIYLPP